MHSFLCHVSAYHTLVQRFKPQQAGQCCKSGQVNALLSGDAVHMQCMVFTALLLHTFLTRAKLWCTAASSSMHFIGSVAPCKHDQGMHAPAPAALPYLRAALCCI
jgi:hypothetical protein